MEYWLEYGIFVLTDHVCNGKQVYKANNKLPRTFDHQSIEFNNLVGSLCCVTDLNVMLPDGKFHTLEQLAFACPNLQRLCLQGNSEDAFTLQGLRTIAFQCSDLCGLSMPEIGFEFIESHLEFWKI